MSHSSQRAPDLARLHFSPFVWVIMLGMNDWGQSAVGLSRFGSAYGAFLDALPPSLKIACMGPTWTSTEDTVNAHGELRDDYRAEIEKVCTARGHAYLEGRDAIPHDATYFVDGLHPNDKGNRSLGTFLIKQLHSLGWLN